MTPPPLLTAAPTETRAAKSAALSTPAKLLTVRNIAKCDMPSRSDGPGVGQTIYAMDGGGPLLPGLWSPRFFFAFVDCARNDSKSDIEQPALPIDAAANEKAEISVAQIPFETRLAEPNSN